MSRVNGNSKYLLAREFQLLRDSIEHRGVTLSGRDSQGSVELYAKTFTRTVHVHIASLRQKLEENPKHPRRILTVPGLGYRFAS